MEKIENISLQEKGKIINEALKIVNDLAENQLPDSDGDGDISQEDFDVERLKRLILKARSLKTDRWWYEIIQNA